MNSKYYYRNLDISNRKDIWYDIKNINFTMYNYYLYRLKDFYLNNLEYHSENSKSIIVFHIRDYHDDK